MAKSTVTTIFVIRSTGEFTGKKSKKKAPRHFCLGAKLGGKCLLKKNGAEKGIENCPKFPITRGCVDPSRQKVIGVHISYIPFVRHYLFVFSFN
tara:strand:- start:1909 stop:2190 length:282 start_codon:yes stop_codon:yes gene_type:complete